MVTSLLVRKDDLSQAQLRTQAAAPLSPGQVRVALGPLALTANNITYAAFGDAMDYWRFFPSGEEGWGSLPMWGFGTVVQSLHGGVAVGERLYGYWPLATQAILQPSRLSPTGLRDGAAHRQPLHAIYNQYTRCNTDPFGSGADEAVQALLRPLFTTAWLIDDFLCDHGCFGAHRVLLSSASSKTAVCTARLLSMRPGIEVVGLTSAPHLAFCASLGCYHRVLAYEQVEQLPSEDPCVYVDLAGSAPLRARVHQHLRQLRHSSAVGGTHVEHLGGAGALPGPRPTLFFAPAQARKRQQEWGSSVLEERLLQAWQDLVGRVEDRSRPWLSIARRSGPAAALDAYREMAAGLSDPRTGLVLDLR